jgi:hypothetical protein
MNSAPPFTFGKIASEAEFTDRDAERQHMMNNFKGGINTILISPRRWGKSSLVNQVAKETIRKEKKIRICLIDLYNIRTEKEFYQELALQVLKTSSTKINDIFEDTKKFLGRLIPKIVYSPDSSTEFSLGLDWQEVKQRPDDIINLSEKIAQEKNIRMVVCIDEFQNISEFENPLAFQKKLRSHWQKHKSVSYCLYGSKRHMMIDVFASPSMPFYKFGDIIFLQKISEPDWEKFIQKRFADTGKKISPENALLIATLAECHPYYVQQLAQLSWLRSSKVCNEEIIHQAMEGLILQLSMLFQTITDSLSTTQINFLKAMLEGVEQFSSKETLSRYNLGTSANILRIRQALLSKEIIDMDGPKLFFLDPVYKRWLRQYYFKQVF